MHRDINKPTDVDPNRFYTSLITSK